MNEPIFKVFYDITLLYRLAGSQDLKTGVTRVIEEWAFQLEKRSDLNVRFISKGKYFALKKYLSEERALNKKYIGPGLCIREEREGRGFILSKLEAFSWEIRSAFQFLKIKGSFIYHQTNSARFPVVSPFFKKGKFLMTVYDLVPFILPQYHLEAARIGLDKLYRSLGKETFYLAISEQTKKDLSEIFGIATDQIFVVPLAANPRIFFPFDDPEEMKVICGRYGVVPGKYLLGLATIEGRKNFQGLLKAFCRMAMDSRFDHMKLLIVGGKGWKTQDLERELSVTDFSEIIQERVIFTGYVEDQYLSAIYSGARCFIYPSFYEGFGLPPLEAMQCGTPVITSNVSSLPEVMGEAGILINPQDTEELQQAMERVTVDDDLKKELSRKSLERSREFSWEKSVARLAEIYRAIEER